MITDKPQDVHLEWDKLAADFHCAATSDDSTPFTLRWYRVMDDGNPDVLVHNTAEVTVSDDGTRLSFRVQENSLASWQQHRGKYRCFVTNGYSDESADCRLDVDDPPPPPTPPPMEETEPAEVTTAAIPVAGDRSCLGLHLNRIDLSENMPQYGQGHRLGDSTACHEMSCLYFNMSLSICCTIDQ